MKLILSWQFRSCNKRNFWIFIFITHIHISILLYILYIKRVPTLHCLRVDAPYWSIVILRELNRRRECARFPVRDISRPPLFSECRKYRVLAIRQATVFSFHFEQYRGKEKERGKGRGRGRIAWRMLCV